MPLPQSAVDGYHQQQRLTVAAVTTARRIWSGMGLGDWATAWRMVGPRLVLTVSAAQLAAADQAAAAFAATVAELSLPTHREGDVNPRALTGAAPDGRDLPGLLYGAVVKARQVGARGASASRALASGGEWLDMAVQTTVADASRTAGSIALAAHTGIGGYVRVVNPPACPRCVILAGRWYRWSTGFKRHPRCDCSMSPSSKTIADRMTVDPMALLRAGHVRGLSQADQLAIDEGADFAQVVNAHRGSSGLTTTEGTTRRGAAGKRLQGRQRLTPAAIIRLSSTRDETLRLLREHAYLL